MTIRPLRRIRRASSILFAAAAVAIPAVTAGAATKAWQGGTGNWNNGPSWNPAGQPNDTDVVTIGQNNAAVTYINTLFPNAVLTSLTVNATNTATLFQSQNVLSAVGETFGFTLAGAMNQSGGTNNVTGNALAIGQGVGGNGSYTLSGTGVLKASVSENIGEQGTGVFTQTGGNNTISGALLFLTIGGDHNASGTYNLSGGTLHAPSITLSNDGAAAAFNHSGGKNTIDDVLEMGDTLNPTGPEPAAAIPRSPISAWATISAQAAPTTSQAERSTPREIFTSAPAAQASSTPPVERSRLTTHSQLAHFPAAMARSACRTAHRSTSRGFNWRITRSQH